MGKPSPSESDDREPGDLDHHKGDLIGKRYEVLRILGRGGFGVVYLVFDRTTESFFALKTPLGIYDRNPEINDRFRREAELWVNLGRHPSVVAGWFVDRIGEPRDWGINYQIYIAMEYIAPDSDGLNSLEGHLQVRPPDLRQSLHWAIQSCDGMEYAFSKGLHAHRDIKPANILVDQEGRVKITDFGLSSVFGSEASPERIHLNIRHGQVGLSCQTLDGIGFGTPTHMPPEQFRYANTCDERSDLYSFGVVLYQLASGGRYPFFAPLPRPGTEGMIVFWNAMYDLHARSPVPELDSPLFPMIYRCMQKRPEDRYPSFGALRQDLEVLLRRKFGETVSRPSLKNINTFDWLVKGYSWLSLNQYQKAVDCYQEALTIDPTYAAAWFGKAMAEQEMFRRKQAIVSYKKFLSLLKFLPKTNASKASKEAGIQQARRMIKLLGELEKD